ncbi:MAG TPA: glycosyl hydrolase, partial [Proteobacteria bacterium]|nr:glycosyl hydrolase [Pseudomonadota bacterium]
MPIHLLFGIHCHQPVGNFDSVLEREVGRAYAPFLEVAEAFPDFHFSAHYSGWLLAWIGDHYPAVLDRLARLVAR